MVGYSTELKKPYYKLSRIARKVIYRETVNYFLSIDYRRATGEYNEEFVKDFIENNRKRISKRLGGSSTILFLMYQLVDTNPLYLSPHPTRKAFSSIVSIWGSGTRYKSDTDDERYYYQYLNKCLELFYRRSFKSSFSSASYRDIERVEFDNIRKYIEQKMSYNNYI